MIDLFKVFNVTSQKEFDNLMEKMDIDMFSTSSIFEIIESNDDIDTCRKNILENVAINDYQNYDLLKEQFNKKPFVRTLKENTESFIVDESIDCQEEDVITMVPEEEVEERIKELEPSIKQEQPQKVYNITINYNKESKVCESSLYQKYNQCVKNNGKLIEEHISTKVNKVIDEWVNNEYEPLINTRTMLDKMKIIEHNDKSGKYIEKIINILSEYE